MTAEADDDLEPAGGVAASGEELEVSFGSLLAGAAEGRATEAGAAGAGAGVGAGAGAETAQPIQMGWVPAVIIGLP